MKSLLHKLIEEDAFWCVLIFGMVLAFLLAAIALVPPPPPPPQTPAVISPATRPATPILNEPLETWQQRQGPKRRDLAGAAQQAAADLEAMNEAAGEMVRDAVDDLVVALSAQAAERDLVRRCQTLGPGVHRISHPTQPEYEWVAVSSDGRRMGFCQTEASARRCAGGLE